MRNRKMMKGKMMAALVLSLALSVGAPTVCLATENAKTVHEIRRVSRKTTTDSNSSTSSKKKKKKKSKAKKAEIKKKKKKAKKYVGKKLTSLVAAIGKYKRLTKANSCYYDGEYDGIAKYDGFNVYCHTKQRKTWYVDSVE